MAHLMDSDDLAHNEDRGGVNVTHKIKRRRTRAERNKLRSKQAAKENQGTLGTDFRKHVKQAQEITCQSRADRSLLGKTVCAITQNRLTMRLGLFNQGKKSQTIMREPVSIPEHVQAKTEEDIRKILDLSNAHLSHPVSLKKLKKRYDHSDTGRSSDDGECREKSRGQRRRSVTTPPSSGKTAISFPRSASPLALMEIDMQPPPKTSPQTLPESPQLQEIAASLLQDLNPQQTFSGRNYMKEVQHDLHWLLKQNATTVEETPMKKTPIGVSSETVKRSLADSMPPPKSTDSASKKSALPQPQSVGMHAEDQNRPVEHQASRSQPQHVQGVTEHPGHRQQNMEADDVQCNQLAPSVPVISIDAITDARSLFGDNDKAMARLEEQILSSSQDKSQTQSLQGMPQNQHSSRACGSQHGQQTCGANVRLTRDQLSCSLMADTQTPSHEMTCENLTLYSSHVPHDHSYLPAMDVDNDQAVPVRSCHHHHPVHCRDGIGRRHCQIHNNVVLHPEQGPYKRSVVAQYVYPTTQLADQLAGQHQFDDLLHMTAANTQHEPDETMDILDFLDQESASSTYQDPLILPKRQRSAIQAMDSSDSDGSPQWLPPEIPPLPVRPPQIQSPSPPQILYPRRLY